MYQYLHQVFLYESFCRPKCDFHLLLRADQGERPRLPTAVIKNVAEDIKEIRYKVI